MRTKINNLGDLVDFIEDHPEEWDLSDTYYAGLRPDAPIRLSNQEIILDEVEMVDGELNLYFKTDDLTDSCPVEITIKEGWGLFEPSRRKRNERYT